MTDYTEQEVRKMARFAHVDGMPETVTEKMLTQFADMLAEREKGAPVAYRAEWNGDVSDEGAYVYCDADDRDFDHQWEPLYTHPAAQPRVPDGYVVVPKEPTEEMLAALDDAQAKWLNCESDTEEFAIRAWEAVVLAAQESGR